MKTLINPQSKASTAFWFWFWFVIVMLAVMAPSNTLTRDANDGSEREGLEVYKAFSDKADDSEFVLQLMSVVRSPLKPIPRLRLSIDVATAGRVLPESLRREWYILLAIESKFDQGAVSGSGALGIGQIVPVDLRYLAKVTKVKATRRDLETNTKINLAMSAALYRHINNKLGSPTLSLIAYNAGLGSLAVKSFRRLISINHESANYVAKHSFIKEMIADPSRPVTGTALVAR